MAYSVLNGRGLNALRNPRAWPAGVAAAVVVTPPSGAQISNKQVSLGNADQFYVTAAGVNGGKGLSQEFVRNNGDNNAGTAHDTWRVCRGYKADTISQGTAAGGYKSIYSSSGSSTYAIGLYDGVAVGAGIDGGDFHGGETIRTSQVTSMDGTAFDPTSQTPLGKKFELTRGSRITWSTATQSVNPYVDVDLYLKWEQDNKIEQTYTITGGAVVLDVSAGSATNGFCDSRYTQLWSADGSTLLANFTLGGSGSYQLPTAQSGSFRMVDPLTGNGTSTGSDYMIWTYSVTGRTLYGAGTPQSDTGLSISYDATYQKFRIKHGGGAAGTFTVTQSREWFNTQPSTITAPYTDNFAGSALGANWKTLVAGGTVVSVASNELTLTGSGSASQYVFPINPTNGPGTYRVSFNYRTGGAYTAGSWSIARSDTVSTGNQLVTSQSFGSAVGGLAQSVDIAIAAGETPWFRLTATGSAGRTVTLGPISIIKIA